MVIEKTEFGPVEVSSVPLPEDLGSDVIGTYTGSGRVLVAAGLPEKGKDWYRVFTIADDGSDVCELFEGCIPKKQGANGIRWMCFADNRRIWLGDYVLECRPDLDHCESAVLKNVVFPDVVTKIPGVFMRWSEPIIAPDNEHVCFSTLTGSGAFNFLGRMVERGGTYNIEDDCIISTVKTLEEDAENPGFYRMLPQRGGEVKQFVRGGRGITLAGGGRSISESALQMLDSDEYSYITDTLGYEETAMFSPNERYAVCMSPRFSPKTDFGVLGVIPMSGDLMTRGRYLNVLYQYAIAGVRFARKGNIGPALIDIKRSMAEGRAYTGVNLSDPDNEWVYYSPISWHPDSTRALWNERTRLAEGPVRCRLRRCRLLDVHAMPPVPTQHTPDRAEIPYALPSESALSASVPALPLKVKGRTGFVMNSVTADGWLETRYDHYSEDGASFYDGSLRCRTPANMFMPGVTEIAGNITVHGAHEGRMDLRLTLRADERFQIHPDFSPAEDGRPLCDGYAEYDGVRRDVKDMSL